MVAITRVTGKAASSDDLAERDYRDIYDELREKCPLRKFAELIGSGVSFAWWQQYEAGEKRLSQERKSELRRAVGLPALPVTVGQATGNVDPDAVVWAVGGGTPDRVVIVGCETHEPLILRLNGDLRVIESFDSAQDARRRRKPAGHIHVGRETWERLNAARLEAGLGWEPFLGQLLRG